MRQDLLEGRDCLHLSLEVFPKVKKDARVSIVILSLQEGIKHRALWASPNIIDLKIEKNSSYLWLWGSNMFYERLMESRSFI